MASKLPGVRVTRVDPGTLELFVSASRSRFYPPPKANSWPGPPRWLVLASVCSPAPAMFSFDMDLTRSPPFLSKVGYRIYVITGIWIGSWLGTFLPNYLTTRFVKLNFLRNYHLRWVSIWDQNTIENSINVPENCTGYQRIRYYPLYWIF